jgi:hypothetical protein
MHQGGIAFAVFRIHVKAFGYQSLHEIGQAAQRLAI